MSDGGPEKPLKHKVSSKMPKEQYMCQLCANHGIFNQPKRGHKQHCKFNHCRCDLCALNTQRRVLDQLERELKTPEDQIDPVHEDVSVKTKSSTPPLSNGLLGKRQSEDKHSDDNKTSDTAPNNKVILLDLSSSSKDKDNEDTSVPEFRSVKKLLAQSD